MLFGLNLRGFMFRILTTLIVVSGMSASPGCAKKKKSDRDTRRDQIRQDAQIKRNELQEVTGGYRGLLASEGTEGQNVSLILETKDIPAAEEGEVDPVLIPTLTGYLQFEAFGGSRSQNSEHVGLGFEVADYDSKKKIVNIVAKTSEYESILIEMQLAGDELEGGWTVPKLSSSGELKLSRASDLFISEEAAGTFNGVYHGTLTNSHPEVNLPESVVIDIVATQDLTKALGVGFTGKLRFYLGTVGSEEYFETALTSILFNPFTSQFLAKTGKFQMTLKGTVHSGRIDSSVFVEGYGEAASLTAQKEARQ